jgi:predicted hydrolase (HD superfamily)
MTFERDQVLALMHEHIKSESLRKHCYAVEGAMVGYAKYYGEEDALKEWSALGLLHDLDYESHPDVHPKMGMEWLKEMDYSEPFIQAIKGHAMEDVSERPTKMAKVLYAVDELASFIVAVALMRPERFDGMSVKSVTKKLKDKAFARAVDREGIKEAAQELGVEMNDHIQQVIEGLQVQEAFLNARGETLL